MKKKLFAALIGIMLLPFGNITAKAETLLPEFNTTDVEEWITPEGSYTYPITPDSDIWTDMTYAEWSDACNMPQELVDMLSTEELVKAALDYPLKMDYIFFDSYSAGIQHLQENSNVYHELFEREDAAEALLTAYESLQVDYNTLTANSKQNSLEESGYDKELVLQLLLASDEIFNQMDEMQVTNLIEIIDEKYEKKLGKCEDFSTASIFFKIRSEDEKSTSKGLVSENIQEDIATSRSATTFRFERSLNIPVTYELNNARYYLGTGYMYDKTSSCREFYDNDYDPVEAGAMNGYYIGTYRTWSHKSGVTKKYNCHSYCWIEKSYDNTYWLDNPINYANATTYFRYDGQNIKIINNNAYIILYDAKGSPIHSVRSVSTSSGSNLTEWKKSTKVESKLGSAGVYETTLEDMFDIYNASYYKVYYRK